jgi:hypothetical protein
LTVESELAHDSGFLEQVVESGGRLLEGMNEASFVRALLQNLASPDAYMRDKLTYRLLATVIPRNTLSDSDIEGLLRIAVDDAHLFWGIGEVDEDSVFMRSFSVLLIPMIVGSDKKAGRLPAQVVTDVTDAVLRYAAMERDRRGYVPGKGWAHSVAHTADALMACGLHPTTSASQGKKILEGVRLLATVSSPLAHLEDDRLAFAAFSIIRRGVTPEGDVERWIDGFWLPEDEGHDGEETISGGNAEHFLRSLYFRFLHDNPASQWLPKILTTLARFDIYQI